MDKGELLFLPPSIRSSGATRDVFVSDEVFAFLHGTGDVDSRFDRAAGRALAKIDAFAAGKTFVMGLNPHKKSPATLVARTDPTHLGVVQLRVTADHPDVRIFGAFAERDVLVLLTWAPKKDLKYRREIRRCKEAWDAILSPFKPLLGDDHGHYISCNVLAG